MVEVNLKEMAARVQCSLPTMAALVERFADFPVIERGGLGKQWRFDAEAVIAFLQAKRDEEAATKAARDEQLAQLTLPMLATRQETEVPWRDRLTAAKLRKMEMEEAKERGFLVPTIEVRDALERAMRRFDQAQRSAVERVVKNHNLPEAVKRSLEREFAEARVAFVRDAGKFLIEPKGDDLALFA